ncbi:hypothetical protein NQ176_g6930 [Zarea fungicola]|uniref:Uncharacterized protein n=1 Tax=Zarea fungicola TaxID=93591 RepID=A0ACC1N1Q6_9HYPO|nr:hypothetical protein NQ176_g6930 [Lecanicillium fungicola]
MAKKTSSLLASSKAVDPQLAALFASSSGPISTPPASRYQEQRNNGRKSKSNDQDSDTEDDDDGDDEVLSEVSEELDYEDDEGSDEDSSEDTDNDGGVSTKEDAQEAVDGDSSTTELGEEVAEPRKDRKRKRKDDNEDLEENYLANLTKDDEEEPSMKRVKADDEAG